MLVKTMLVSDLFELLGYGLFFFASFFVCLVSSIEVLHISSHLVARGDPDLSHGLQIRRWFMAIIAVANGVRAACVLLQGLYTYICVVLLLAVPSGLIPLTLQVLPSLFYFTMYSLLTVYFAQLCYTVNGLPFFHVRNLWFLTNVCLYALMIVCLIFKLGSSYVFGMLFFSYCANLIVTAWFGVSIFKFFPSSTVLSASSTTSVLHPPLHQQQPYQHSPLMNAANNNSQRIVTVLLPLIITCCSGLAIGVINFLVLALQVLPSSISSTPPISPQVLLEIFLLFLAEVLPSLGFLYLIYKRDTSTSLEEPSLLSRIGAAIGRSNINIGDLGVKRYGANDTIGSFASRRDVSYDKAQLHIVAAENEA